MQIVGTHGDVAEVNKYGQVQVQPQTASPYRNSLGQAFAAYFAQTPGGATTDFAALSNNTVYPVVVDAITLTAASAETVRVYVGNALGVSSGTDATLTQVIAKCIGGQSVSLGSNFWYVDNTVTVTDTGSLLDTIGIGTAKATVTYAPESKIILPPGKMLWLKAVSGSIALEGAVHFYVAVS